MKVDFRKIEVKDIEGNTMMLNDGTVDYRDISKVLGNNIFFGVDDISQQEIGREIYVKGEVDVTPEKAVLIRDYVDKRFLAFIKVSVFPLLDEIINNSKK